MYVLVFQYASLLDGYLTYFIVFLSKWINYDQLPVAMNAWQSQLQNCSTRELRQKNFVCSFEQWLLSSSLHSEYENLHPNPPWGAPSQSSRTSSTPVLPEQLNTILLIASARPDLVVGLGRRPRPNAIRQSLHWENNYNEFQKALMQKTVRRCIKLTCNRISSLQARGTSILVAMTTKGLANYRPVFTVDFDPDLESESVRHIKCADLEF